MTELIVAIYEELQQARSAINDLLEDGVEQEKISLLAHEPDEATGTAARERAAAAGEDARDVAAKGAMAGGAAGGLAGLLLGVATMTIPGAGAIVIAGPIYTAVLGATGGTVGGGLLSGLVKSGIPSARAGTYAESVRRGGILVAVNVAAEDRDRVRDILRRHDPLDIEQQEAEWREGGWTGYDEAPAQYEPAEDEVEDKHRYVLGAWGSDQPRKRPGRGQDSLS